jgi:hypothetical protein
MRILWLLPLLASCNALFPFAPDQICETQLRAACHFAYACCNSTERGTFASALGVDGFRSESECIDFKLRSGSACGNSLAVVDAVNENRFTYDASLAQKCLGPEIGSLNQCEADKVFQPDKLDPSCSAFPSGDFAFGTGDVAAKGKCFAGFECAVADSACVVKPDDGSDGKVVLTDVGFCQSPGNLGDDCAITNGLCAAGLFCDVDNKCSKIDLKSNGSTCTTDGECLSDFCNDGTCGDKLADGKPCKHAGDCVSNICAKQICTPQPTLVVDACNGIQADDTSF